MTAKHWLIPVVAILYLKICRIDDFNPDVQIKGKNVLVTGASSGIGEQLAYHYARMGANVFITARREKLLKKVIEKCRSLGQKDAVFGYLAADMEMYDVTAANVISDAVSALGGLDHIILNHAILSDFKPWTASSQDLSDFERIIDVNLVSYVHLVSQAMPHLRKSQFGRVAVTSSIAGKIDVAYQGAYSSSKFGLDGFFSALRQEFKNHKENISVTVCNLGLITTDKGNAMMDTMSELFKVNLKKLLSSPLAPTASPEDTALEVIKATVKGQRELYFPPLFGSRYLQQMMPVIRHIYPSLLAFDPSTFQ